MSSSSSAEVLITHVLTEISDFLDVESTVHLSRTCRFTHGMLTEDTVGQYPPKMKVSYFSMGDSSLWRDENGRSRIHPGEPHHGKNLMTLSTRVLSQVHFPSLKKLEFRFPAGKKFVNADDEVRDSFIHLAIDLEHATNLEELTIDIGLIMKYDTFNTRMIYETFAENLTKCTKLKKLTILNQYKVQGGKTYYSAGFLLALLPAIKRGVNSIKEMTLLIGNQPATPPQSTLYLHAARDLFTAILRLQKLKVFNLQLNLATSPLLNVFLHVAGQICRTLGMLPSSESIEQFNITCALYKTPEGVPNPLPAPLTLAPCVALLGNCSNLRSVVIRVPPACWDSSGISHLKNLLSNKPNLRHLRLYFHGYECTSGKTLEYLLDYIQEREMWEDNLIHISGLECYNARFNEDDVLDRYYSRDGTKCLSVDAHGLKFEAKGLMIPW